MSDGPEFSPLLDGDDWDERVRIRAYQMWEADGRPDGMEDHYWHVAEAVERRRRQAEDEDEEE